VAAIIIDGMTDIEMTLLAVHLAVPTAAARSCTRRIGRWTRDLGYLVLN
jgi:hypothetical protein